MKKYFIEFIMYWQMPSGKILDMKLNNKYNTEKQMKDAMVSLRQKQYKILSYGRIK